MLAADDTLRARGHSYHLHNLHTILRNRYLESHSSVSGEGMALPRQGAELWPEILSGESYTGLFPDLILVCFENSAMCFVLQDVLMEGKSLQYQESSTFLYPHV